MNKLDKTKNIKLIYDKFENEYLMAALFGCFSLFGFFGFSRFFGFSVASRLSC
jgi:hypothetical protein